MTAPPCTRAGCPHPVKPRLGPVSRLGRRIIDGVDWCWFCSRSCAGRVQGRLRVAEDRVKLAHAAHMRKARERRLVWYGEDAASLKGYGVPESIVVAMLDRAYQRGVNGGYNRFYMRQKQRTLEVVVAPRSLGWTGLI